MRRLGAVALAFFAVHAAWHLARGTAGDLLWACNVAAALLAVGCFARSPRAIATATLWLAYGAPMWILDVATGGDFVPTSILTHLGGLVIGVLALRRLGSRGLPRGSWAVASLGTLALLGATRLLGSPARNQNLAFRVHDGWESRFPSHATYLAMMWLGSAAAFFVIEVVVRRVIVAAHERQRPRASGDEEVRGAR